MIIPKSITREFSPRELTMLRSMKKKLKAVAEKPIKDQKNALVQAVKAISKEQTMKY